MAGHGGVRESPLRLRRAFTATAREAAIHRLGAAACQLHVRH